MISRITSFILLLTGLLALGCSNQRESDDRTGQSTRTVSVQVTDPSDKTLPMYGLQVINANDGWLGEPQISAEGSVEKPATAVVPAEQPAILKFKAPGYQPMFTFLMPGTEPAGFRVRLKTPVTYPEPAPIALGNFNNYDFNSAVDLKKGPDGVWSAEIETELDTVYYVVSRYATASLPGTNGELVMNKGEAGFDRAFLSRIIKAPHQTSVTVELDPSEYSFKPHDAQLTYVSDIPNDVEGVSRAYTRMISEYMNFLFSRSVHSRQDKESRYEHDYSSLLTDLANLSSRYDDPEVTHAARLAKLRFYPDIDVTADEASSLLNNLAPDSPLWLFDAEALTNSVTIAGLEENIDILAKIALGSPYKTIRGEALYNAVRHYYQRGNVRMWHATFFELASNYPNHYRTTYAYNRYAPEQPIKIGKALHHRTFNSLEGNSVLDLYDLSESYLLLDFWSTSCGACIEAMSDLHEIHEQFSGPDFAIVSISLDEHPERIATFRKNKWEMPWYHAYEGRNSAKIRELGIISIPRYILLGPDRTVLVHDQSLLRGEKLKSTLEKVLSGK